MRTYAIATALVKNNNNYLVAKRSESKEFAPGKWEFISGFLDIKTTIEEIINNELNEELNNTGKIIAAEKPFEFTDAEARWIVIPYLLELSGEIAINKEDHSEVKWVSKEELFQFEDLKPFLTSESIQKLLNVGK